MHSSPANPIRRDSTVDQLQELLAGFILEGRLAADSRVNEVQLAGELGVSRTPLREALSRLSETGLLLARPYRGFFVAPLSARDAGELYELLALLEADALDLAPPPDASALRRLRQLNAALGRAGSAADVIEANTAWHRALVARCPNRQLIDLLESVRTRLRRYEFRYFAPGRQRVLESMRRHREVITCLARGDRQDARRALRDHWQTDLDVLLPETAQADGHPR